MPDTTRSAPPSAAAAAGESPLRAGGRTTSPYLHVGSDRIYNPLDDRSLREEEPEYSLVKGLIDGEVNPAELSAESIAAVENLGPTWLPEPQEDLSRSYFLRYVSLEAHTVCNQACYFCPVSIAPREDHFMPTELYERIVGELSAYRDTIEGVAMINYNEPTLDKRFVDQVRTLREAGLPPAVLTNGTGLTRKRVDAIIEMGGLHYLSINLSTLDRGKYTSDRAGDHLAAVLQNVDYMADKPVAQTMEVVVLGTDDDRHRSDYEEIRERFRGSRFDVKTYEVMDRAGLLQIGQKPADPHQQLCGCQNLGSRPLQHLHITPHAKVVLCCEDYDEKYIVGDLNEESVEDVLTGDRLALLRRWVYGVEEAPEDFICRKCIYARTR